jgi:hypothetical protein
MQPAEIFSHELPLPGKLDGGAASGRIIGNPGTKRHESCPDDPPATLCASDSDSVNVVSYFELHQFI